MNGHVSLWDVICGWRITRTIDHSGGARAVAFSPDGHWLAVGALQQGISLYDRGSSDVEPAFGIPFDAVTAMAFSPDGRILGAASSSHHEVLLWDLEAGRERARLRGHESPVFSLAMAPDSRLLATAGLEDGKIIIWNLDTQRPRFQLEVPKAPVMALAYSPDGTMLASAGSYPLPVRVWDTRSGRLLWHVGAHSAAASANAVAFSRDGRLLAVAGCEGGLELWSADTGRKVGGVKVPGDRLCGVGFSPDGRTLVATGFDNDVRLWRVEDLARAESESTP
jgi:WD40 repeat protein